MDQSIINWALAGISGAIGFWVKAIWDSINELRRADKELIEKVKNIEVLVAGDYVKRDELDKRFDRLFQKLDTIELHVSGKVDGR